MQAEAVRWSAEVAGRRPCRPLDGAAPAAVFEAAEKGALSPLPRVPAPAGDGGAPAFLHGPQALFAAEPAAGGNVVALRPAAPGAEAAS